MGVYHPQIQRRSLNNVQYNHQIKSCCTWYHHHHSESCLQLYLAFSTFHSFHSTSLITIARRIASFHAFSFHHYMQPNGLLYVCMCTTYNQYRPHRKGVLTENSIYYVGLTAGLGIVTLGLSGFRITSPKRSSSLGRA